MDKVTLHSAILLLVFPASVLGMGLGDLRVTSHLDQPFHAEVVLLDLGNTPIPSVKINAASDDEYERTGLVKSPSISLLKFDFDKNAKGRLIVRITSTERITEPYLDLLLDLAWPTGQVYKEYQVLLDPAGYAFQVKGGTRIKASYTSYTYRTDTHTEIVERPSSVHAIYAVPSLSGNKQLTYGPVASGEMIWQIAQHYKIPELQLSQLVLGIVGMNPGAFEDGNLNGLKTGVRLVIPAASLVEKIPADLAAREVLAQDQAWKAKTPIEHVIEPPYYPAHEIAAQEESLPRDSAYSSKIPSAPVFKAEIEKPLGIPAWIINEIPGNKRIKDEIPVIAAQNVNTIPKPQSDSTQNNDNEKLTNQLQQQMQLLVEQNKNMQKQLEQRDADFAEMKRQLLLLTTQRQPVGAQVHTGKAPDEGGTSWYLWLLLLASGGGLLYGLWRANAPLPDLVHQGVDRLKDINPWKKEDISDEDEPEESADIHPVETDVSKENINPQKAESIPEAIHIPVNTPQPEIKASEEHHEVYPEKNSGSEDVVSKIQDSDQSRTEPKSEEMHHENEEEEISHIEYTPPDLSEFQSEKKPNVTKAVIPDEDMIEYQPGLLGAVNIEDHEPENILAVDDTHEITIEETEPEIENPVNLEPAQHPEATETEDSTKLTKSYQALDTLLALSETYLSMGDKESARQSLEEVLEFGNDAQKAAAKVIFDKLG